MATTITANNVDNRTGAMAGDIHYVGTSSDGTVYAATANGSNDILDGAGGNDYLNGGSGNDSIDGGTGNDTLVGGTGNDVYIFDSFGDRLTELANQGNDTLIIDAANTMGTNIVLSLVPLTAVENLDISRTGTQRIDTTGNTLANVLTGNDAANYIQGLTGNDTLIAGLGNDVLDGGVGADSMDGGAGDDIYFVDNIADVIIDSQGLNELRSTISYSIASNNTFNNLVLLGSANINATGNSINNLLLGNDGNNILDGGAGDDDMEGGKGNDTYLWRDAADSFFEAANEGIDTLKVMSDFGFSVGADLTLTLGSDIENLDASQINGVKFDLGGNSLANILTGNDADNDLSGLDGNDTLVGGAGNDGLLGGAGVDSLIGGMGDDIYAVNLKTTGVAGTASAVASLEDIIVESTLITAGNDSLRLDGTANLTKASTIILAAGLENIYVENTLNTKLNLTGNASANDMTGNDADNIILGLGGNDTLVGGAGDDTLDGGVGSDLLSGGAGNDTYISEIVLFNGSTQINDTYAADASGIDTIKFTGQSNAVSYLELSLAALSDYENIDISATATTKLNLTGNSVNNNLIGNAANNLINSGLGNDTLNGGLGNDTMIGGAGNDSYFVNVLTDIITEFGGEGIDTINATMTYSLVDTDGTGSNGGNVENLTLMGTIAINGTGNDLNNTLTGNAAANILSGGIGLDTLLGAAGADTLDGGVGADTMDGGDGADIYIVDNINDTVTETNSVLATGGNDLVKSSALNFTLSSNIEKLTLTGTGNINGMGNALNNTLTGNASSNTLEGGAGNDTMIGGDGNDTYFVDSILDITTETNALIAGGTDTVISSVTRILTLNLENLTLTGTHHINGTGNNLDNIITGNSGNNLLSGGAGIDQINGGLGDDTLDGGTGIDDLVGGSGNDTYVIDNIGDTLFENTGDSSDTVKYNIATTVAKTLMAGTDLFTNIENITLVGTGLYNLVGDANNNILIGNASANTITGNAGDDTLVGGVGNDSLIGGLGEDILDGGLGNDTMEGGNGNDNYVVNSLLDKVTELNTEGTDTIQSTITYSLIDTDGTGTNGGYVENLTLLGAAAINAIGNNLNNTLIGNTATNILDGGLGNDAMNGGAGSDTYIVDNEGDTVTESISGAIGGADLVKSAVTFALGANIEKLTLTDSGNINGTGNDLNNTIIGNTGNNNLDGSTGVDMLQGGLGNDIYTVDLVQTGTTAATFRVALQDTITEAINAGNDSLILRGSFDLLNATTLTLASTLENLDASLTDKTKLNLTGNALNNILIGNNADNTLKGGLGNDNLLGGNGNDYLWGDGGADTLAGGAGADTFEYMVMTESQVGATTHDVITDFTSGVDTIDLSHLDANTATAGNQAFTFIDTAFTKVAGQLRFDSASHMLLGDVDGNGVADFQIELLGVTTLNPTTDFIF